MYEVVKGKELAKPRTYRKKARKHYLAAARSRHLVAKKRSRAVGRQLAYVQRNLNSINMLLENSKTSPLSLSRYEYKCLLVTNELHRQQQHMYKSRTCQIDDRIVSISQPHVCPIIRGKAGAKVTEENREELEAAKLMARQDELNRIPVEGKFGQGKRRFGLSRIMAKLADTSITSIIIGAVVMNLTRWLKSLFAAD